MIYSHKLTVKQGEEIYLCNIYKQESDALTFNDSAILVKLDGESQGYIGLSRTQNEYSTPLKALKDGVEYFVQKGKTEVQYVAITFPATVNQKIKVTCNGVTTYITSESVKYQWPINSEYSIELIPNDRYIAGTLTGIDMNGTVTPDMDNITVNISDAFSDTVRIAITQPTGATITATYNGMQYTSEFIAAYNGTINLSMNYETGYEGGTFLVNGSQSISLINVTSDTSISATGITKKKYTITLVTGEGIATVYMSSNGYEVANGGKVEHGSNLLVSAIAQAGYADPTIIIR